jgi:hypothetical protein
MKKKIIIYFLIIAFLNYLGCTSLNIASKEEVKQKLENGTYYQELYLITKDNNRYHFGKRGYHIKNDTLYAKGLKVNMNGEVPFEGKIRLEDISYFEVEELNTLSTVGLVLGIGALAITVLVLVLAIGAPNRF